MSKRDIRPPDGPGANGLRGGRGSYPSGKTAIGVWFLAGGVGGLIAGPVGALYSSWSRSGFFTLLRLVCYADSALVALVSPKLHRAAAASIEDGESKRKREDAQYCNELGEMQMADKV